MAPGRARSALDPHTSAPANDPESRRLAQDAKRDANWKRWGPYLSERQWGTVREDYSHDGDVWRHFPHEHARSRAYRWGEDGLLGFCDRQGRLCFAPALWNGRDSILKERLFGLAGHEGNHGEDVKEVYHYLDATPTHSWMRALYKYPLAAFPYAQLAEENARRSRQEPEYELIDTGVFERNHYVDVFVEYAKAGPEDLLVRLVLHNRSAAPAALCLLAQLWFRNTWSWGRSGEGYWQRPELLLEAQRGAPTRVLARHASLGEYEWVAGPGPRGEAPELLFTGNETNYQRLFGLENQEPYVKDAFHDYVVHGRREAVHPEQRGTKAAALWRLELSAHGTASVELRLRKLGRVDGRPPAAALGSSFARTFAARQAEADSFYDQVLPAELTPDERAVARQAYAGLLWSKQFYYYVPSEWLEGDPIGPSPPPQRKRGRNSDWRHIHNRDVISMPDKWEYPWYAAWDLAFHMLPFARVDLEFAKAQLLLFLREWYMHPNGQLPAYEFALADVNPPVHAWACWRVYKLSGPRGARDREFLARCFQKLLLNFTWWVNRKDADGANLFSGGFLGLDNIGPFDRSAPLPAGVRLEQADGTAWMAFYALTMLSMALELALEDPSYEDLASKFLEHFAAIAEAMNSFGGSGLWDELDGFYYDHLREGARSEPLRLRSLVGVVPLFAVATLEDHAVDRLPGFKKRLQWFVANRPAMARHLEWRANPAHGHGHRLLAIPSRERLERVLRCLLDEREFLSPYGLRSLSRRHQDQPYEHQSSGGSTWRVAYTPGDSDTSMFGGNSNWRGPVWLPMNYLLIEALERFHHFYGDEFRVECPTGSGIWLALDEVAGELSRRLTRLFLPDARGQRPCHGGEQRYAEDPHWKELVHFHEFFHGETGRGLGASHQTGWTSLVVRNLEDLARARASRSPSSTRRGA